MRRSRLFGAASAAVLVILGVVASAALSGAESQLGVVPVGNSPTTMAINPLTHTVYVTNYYSHTVSVIDGVSESVVATLDMTGSTTQKIPNAIVVDYVAKNPTAYAANFWSHNIAVIDEKTATVTANFDVPGAHGSGPRSLALNPSSNPPKLYVANYGNSSVSVYNARTRALITTIPTGSSPRALAIFTSASRERVYVANRGTNSVTILDGETDTAIGTVATGGAPKNVVVHPSTGVAYVTNEASGTVSVIGTGDTVTDTIPVQGTPVGMAIDEAGGRLFVTNNASASVSVVNLTSNTVDANVPVGLKPLGVAFDATRNKAFVACTGSNSVSIIDGALGVTSVGVGVAPKYVAVDDGVTPSRIYVTNSSNPGSVSILGDLLMGSAATRALTAPPAFAAQGPVALSMNDAAYEPGTGFVLAGGATNLRTPFVSEVVAVYWRLDDQTAWQQAEIVSGAGTPEVAWRAVLGEAQPGQHVVHVAAIDQAGAVRTSGNDVGAAGAAWLSSQGAFPVDFVRDTEAPAVSMPFVQPLKVKAGSAFVVAASASDASRGSSAILSMSCAIDGGTPVEMTPADRAFDSPQESAFVRLIAPPQTGTHTVAVFATDAAGNTGRSAAVPLRVIGRAGSSSAMPRYPLR